MMDLTRSITYQGVDLNDATPTLGKPGLTGHSVDLFDMTPIPLNQYMDKTSQADGMDFQGVGNLEEGARHITMRGMVYGTTRPLFWDALIQLRVALDPVQAYRTSESAEGFLPLAYSVPTGPSGAFASRYVLARPNGLHYMMDRDKQGSSAKVTGQSDATAMGLPWTCEWLCRDPRVYGTLHTVNLTGAGASSTWTNAGDYPSLVDCTFVVGSAAGSVHVVLGGADFTIPIAAGANPRTIYYRGRTKLLTVLDAGVESLRMDMLVFASPNSDTQHPLIQSGVSSYAVTASGVTLQSGSSIAFTDAYS